ncbi:hypothetical protein GCM10020000_47730 [Streptomyces olivoverticillatus]
MVPATDPGDADSTVYVDMRRILHDVDPPAEWRQAYAEAGRIVRAYFWEPGMCGVDWDGVLEQYRPLVERVATPRRVRRPAARGPRRAGHLARLRHPGAAQRGAAALPAGHRPAGGPT